ncbi:tigger transposable element-derived protein 1 [Trichonephila clavipes]|uniref:Tigger transposable element-derived protein 1 n=1 Tax=Trichonephila clavipes TaxID=2585209 RepID=A0A8X6UZT1_TRICX|nr:tigger transposable element-derived protein 1 [Trichonephila clavipes]
MESVPEPNEIGNIIEEVVDLARQINSEVDSDNLQKLLDSHNKEQVIDEIIEMYEQKQDVEELESLISVQLEDRMTVGNLTESLSSVEKGLKSFENTGESGIHSTNLTG